VENGERNIKKNPEPLIRKKRIWVRGRGHAARERRGGRSTSLWRLGFLERKHGNLLGQADMGSSGVPKAPAGNPTDRNKFMVTLSGLSPLPPLYTKYPFPFLIRMPPWWTDPPSNSGGNPLMNFKAIRHLPHQWQDMSGHHSIAELAAGCGKSLTSPARKNHAGFDRCHHLTRFRTRHIA